MISPPPLGGDGQSKNWPKYGEGGYQKISWYGTTTLKGDFYGRMNTHL